MENTILENIQRHLTMLDLALLSSEKIKAHASIENLEGVIFETDNRERLVNIVGQLQQQVEEKINSLTGAELNHEIIMILKTWFQDLSIWSEKMLACDRETVEMLGQQKESATREIAHIFKNKEMFKGYSSATKK